MCYCGNKKGKGALPYRDYVLIISGTEKEKRANAEVRSIVRKIHEKAIKEYKFLTERILLVTEQTKGTAYILLAYMPQMKANLK
jgi:hypothetical protein